MKKVFYLLLALLLLSVAGLQAQVTIGSQADPHAGAVLDLQTNGSHGGFLLPQVVLTSATVWAPLGGTATNGMMVFNTSTSTANDLKGTGVYYWMNGKWTMVETETGTIKVISIAVNPTTLNMTVGTTQQLTATITPSNANQGVTWTSSNLAVATVDENGLVTAVSGGLDVTITATSAEGGKKATCSVNVTPAFACGNTLTDREGKTYTTKLYGTMCVMTQNLRVLSARDGTPLTITSSVGYDGSGSNGYRYCEPGTITSNLYTYGALYDWKSAQNVCPTGWKLPSDADWTLLQAAGVSGASELNARWRQFYPGWMFNGSPVNLDFGQFFWSSTAITSSVYAYSRGLDANITYPSRNTSELGYFFSVRCLKE